MAREPRSRQPDEMFCPTCGAVVKRGVRFCPQCGTNLPAAPEAVSPPGGPYVSPPPKEDVAGVGRYILNFFLAGLIGLGLTFFLRTRGWLATWISLGILVFVVTAAVGVTIAVVVSGGDVDDRGGGRITVPTIPRRTDIAQEGHMLGSADAPVTLVEYTDFQCHFCFEVHIVVLPNIEIEFVSSDQVKVEMRPIAILGEESEWAAQAAECANDQGRFWEFHDTLYINQGPENVGRFSRENLKRIAEALELDTVAFDSCLDLGKYASKVRDDTEAARQEGISSVPTILVNGQVVAEATDTYKVRAAIQEALGSGP